MSESRTEQIKCPRCHYDSPMTVWNSINADLDPELKEKLLDGELYHWKCEVCGLEIDVPFGTLYHAFFSTAIPKRSRAIVEILKEKLL